MKKFIYIMMCVLVLGRGGSAVAQELPKNQSSEGPSAALFPASDSAAKAQIDAEIEKTTVDEKNQAAVYDKKDQSAGVDKTEAIKQTATEGLSCIGGQALGQAVASAISSEVTKAVGAVVDAVTNVPTNEQGQSLRNSNRSTAAQVGTPIFAGISLPSWDSIGYCVVNSMIDYVANSTIAWVQGGFQGNPAFVNNPEQFFKDLADVEASAFLRELAYGTIGANICEPFRAQIVLTIARNHTGGQQAYGGQGGYSRGGFQGGGAGGGTYGGCTLDDIKGNLQGFLRGDFQKGGWDSWFKISQVESNNPYSTYFNLQAQLDGAVNKKKTLAERELNWGKGFLSFRKCTEKTPKDKQKDCPITTPGSVIENQLNKTLGISKDRLVLAEKFDQVVAAVVNQLIQVALDKVLDSVAE